MQFRRYLRDLDWWLVSSVLALIAIGLGLIASATHSFAVSTGKAWHVERQSIFTIINIFIIVGLMRFDYRQLKYIAKPLYFFNLIMFIAVMLIGQTQLGAQRWIQIGPVSIQPSEFSKILMIICLAAFLDKKIEYLHGFKDYLSTFFVVLIPFVLVMKQQIGRAHV